MAFSFRYPISFGNLELAVVSFQMDVSRRLAEWPALLGRGSTFTDRGSEPRKDSWTIALPDEDAERVRASVIQAFASGEARMLSHPLDGSWLARISQLSEGMAAGTRTMTLSFVEDSLSTNPSATPLELTSAQAVEARADLLEQGISGTPDISTELASLGISVAESARENALSWDTSAPSSGELAQQLEALHYDMDLLRGGLEQSSASGASNLLMEVVLLRAEIERFSQLVVPLQATFPVTVLAAGSLWRLVAAFYDDIEAAFTEVVQLNSLRSPLFLYPGQTLLLPRTI